MNSVKEVVVYCEKHRRYHWQDGECAMCACPHDDCQQDKDKCCDCKDGSLYDNECHRDDCGRRNDDCADCYNGSDYTFVDI
jgi:hypothetical protein